MTAYEFMNKFREYIILSKYVFSSIHVYIIMYICKYTYVNAFIMIHEHIHTTLILEHIHTTLILEHIHTTLMLEHIHTTLILEHIHTTLILEHMHIHTTLILEHIHTTLIHERGHTTLYSPEDLRAGFEIGQTGSGQHVLASICYYYAYWLNMFKTSLFEHL
jgi:hypothetical protein